MFGRVTSNMNSRSSDCSAFDQSIWSSFLTGTWMAEASAALLVPRSFLDANVSTKASLVTYAGHMNCCQ